jgi:hypothetical protein
MGLRSLMDADGAMDGVETILFFAIGFAAAAVISYFVFALVHAMFGTFVNDSPE